MALELHVDGTDVLAYVSNRSISVKNTAYRQTGILSFQLEGDPDDISVASEDEVIFGDDIGGGGEARIYGGFVRNVERSDLRPDWVYLKVDCQDYTTLPGDDVIDDTSNFSALPVGVESDATVIEFLFDQFGTKGVTIDAEVQEITADLLTAVPTLLYDMYGMTLAQALDHICELTDGRWYVDADKALHYFATESSSAPHGLSDTPNGSTTFGYRELRIPDESTGLVNAVFAYNPDVAFFNSPPAGVTNSDWFEDAGSIAAYGRRAMAIKVDATEYTEVQARAESILAASKDPIRQLSLVTFEPGLAAGMTVAITAANHGLSAEPFRISSVETTYPIYTAPEYKIECGERSAVNAASDRKAIGDSITEIIHNAVGLCESAVDCEDLTDEMLTAGTATNGNAESGASTQWSGGSASGTHRHGGSGGIAIASTADGTITYTFDPAQVFTKGTRYVLDIWTKGLGDRLTNTLRFGVPDLDEEVFETPDSMESETGADGATWQRDRICWTPTTDRTGVRFSYRGTQTPAAVFAADDLVLYTTDNNPLAGTSPRAARCDHGHHARDIPLRPPPGMEATDVQAGFDEIDERIDALGLGGEQPVTEHSHGDFIVATLSNPPTQAEIETAIGATAAMARGTVYGLQDSGTEKRYLALTDGVQWHIVPLVNPVAQEGVAALTSAPAGGWAQTHSAHYYNGVTYFAYVRGDNGNVELRTYTHATQTVSSATVMRSALLDDLHAAPSLVVRQSDHRIHAFYSDHAGSAMYQWISTNAEDISAGTETNLDSQLGGVEYTYPMIADLESGLYLFVRHISGMVDEEWGYAVTTDDGTTWSALTSFYTVAGKTAYCFVQKTGPDRVDVIGNDDISLGSDQSIHHFSFDGATAAWRATDGTLLTLPIGAQSEIVAWDGTTLDDARGRFDVQRGADGHPRILFGTINGSTFTYRHGRWTGSEWVFTALLSGTQPVAALARFDSANTNILYLSDSSDEMRRLTTLDEETWASETLTSGTTSIYPISPVDHPPDLPVVWLTGSYTAAEDYSLGISGFGATLDSASVSHVQRVVILDDTDTGEAIIRRTSAGAWEISRDDGGDWESLGGAGTVFTVDAGTPDYSGFPTVGLTSKWGIDSGGNPYFNDAGVTSGEEAALMRDSQDGTYFLRPYNF